MSKCISRNGEFSDHELGEGTHEFTCSRCWAFDEDAAIATVAELRQKLSDCELLLTDLGKTHTRVSGERDELREKVDRVRALVDDRDALPRLPIGRGNSVFVSTAEVRAALDGGAS